jgi:alpha-beta hydrolase superfamily lysophospholipase
MNPTNDLDMPTAQREYKTYATLAAQLAMRGYALVKADPAVCGQVPYYAMRLGLAKPLPDLDAVRNYLAALMGAGDGKELQG